MATKKLSDCGYNYTKVLSKKGALVYRLEQYIKDAKKMKSPMCVKMWQQIKKDELKHMDMLKQAIAELAKKGKL